MRNQEVSELCLATFKPKYFSYLQQNWLYRKKTSDILWISSPVSLQFCAFSSPYTSELAEIVKRFSNYSRIMNNRWPYFGLANSAHVRDSYSLAEHFVRLEAARALGTSTKPWHCPFNRRMTTRNNYS